MIDETQKMQIEAYKDTRFSEPADVQPFKAHVNPENYTKSVYVNYSRLQASGSSAGTDKHERTNSQDLSFDFLLDRTGALGNLANAKEGVSKDIAHFKKLVLKYEGETHRPRYLKLIWGSLLFKCQLQSLSVEHKMFNNEGEPLRAVLKATFLEYTEEEERVIRENKSSPDLTHVRTVQQGDTLPLMTHRIYGDAAYYLEVARINGITNFRDLEPGRKINFPPVNKAN